MIKCICIDDTNKPSVIPKEKWIEKDKEYHITYIYVMKNQIQFGIQGCDIAEIDISDYHPYNCFRLSRFAFSVDDLEALINIMIECGKMNNVSMDDLLKVEEKLKEEVVLV